MKPRQTVERENDKKTPHHGQEGKKGPRQWHKPVLEDVTGKVMAQPYIRFT